MPPADEGGQGAAEAVDVARLSRALLHVCERVTEAREELGRLDAAAGDGDLGVTLATGFRHVRERLEGGTFADVGALLKGVGLELARRAPSTMGTLLGTAFLRAGARMDGVVALGPGQVPEILAAVADGVRERGRAAPGQRTVLDAMIPSADDARVSAEDGAGVLAVLAAAATGAHRGAAATAEMEPVIGRAGWVGSRASGTVDAGATAWAVIMAALAEGVAEAVAGG